MKAKLIKVRVPFRKSQYAWKWTDEYGVQHQIGVGPQVPGNGAVMTSTGMMLDLHTGELYQRKPEVDIPPKPQAKQQATANISSSFTDNMAICPRCEGTGEEPGAPYDPDAGMALCILCQGARKVTEAQAKKYTEEED